MYSDSGSAFGTLILILLLVAAGIGFFNYQKSKKNEGDWRLVKNLPPSVQGVVAKMSPENQTIFFNELESKRKSLAISFLLWIIGFHYLYMSKIGIQFAFWFTGGGCGIWWFIDVFRLPGLIRDRNEQAAREAIQTIAMGQAFGTNQN